MCDDCDVAEVASRAPRPRVLRCLEHALSCGPEPDERARWAEHGDGAVPAWTSHFYLRAVVLLAGLEPEGRDVLERSFAWALPADAARARDRALAAPAVEPDPGPPPPAGMSACRASPSASNVVDAALACFGTRVKPAIVGLGAREADYRFGRDSYVQTTYALRPDAAVAERGWAQYERNLRRMPDSILRAVTALGAMERVDPRREWIVVTVRLRSPNMPTDGDTQLQFVVDAETWATVFVYRLGHG